MALNIYSINVNGLRNRDKVKAVFGLLTDWRCDYCLLQETFWDNEFVEEIKHLWDGVIFHSNNENRHSGVAILVNKTMKNYSKLANKDSDGRMVSIDIKHNGYELTLMSIYAPNKSIEKVMFFSNLMDYLSNNKTVIGGDFNTSLSHVDRCNTMHICDTSYKKLKDLMSECQLYDVWRGRNPDSKIFSWKRIINNQLKASRIDYFLIDNSYRPYVKYICYKETTLSDHSFIYMKIDFSNIDKGKGVWILNNKFLDEKEYHDKIINVVQRAKTNPLYNDEMLVWWDNVKYQIKRISQNYGQNRSRKKYERYNRLQKKFQDISESIAMGHIEDTCKYEELKGQLAELENDQCQGAILRSKAYWAVESDKNTKFFLNLEKARQNSNTINELIDENGIILRDTDSILEEQYKYYKNLYSCVEVNERDINVFLDKIDVRISKEDRDMCDNDFTKKEIYTALMSMSKNKSPGTDGLSVEFYVHFWEYFEDIFMKLFTCIQEESIMSRSMRHGMITLIHKKNDKRLLKNWRPISLLNVDYKILARTMSNRLKNVLPHIISLDQSACIVGRDISDTISSIRDIIELTESEKLEGYLIKIDQQKAFDRVDHKFLMKCLDKYGFGDKFKKWIRIFYTDIYSTVKCNGYLTKYFNVKNSVRQGCPISALLFVLTAEPLNHAIKSCSEIRGITIPDTEIESVLFQHADDTTFTVCDKKSIAGIFQVFDNYSKASGAKINRDKTEIMCMGKGVLSNAELANFSITECKDILQILGVYLGKNLKLCDDMNWNNRVTKLKQILNMWKQRNVNIHGRATIITTLLLSRLWYVLMVQPIPSPIVCEIKKTCMEFLWLKKSHPVKYCTVIGDKKMGGLNIPDIELKTKAFRLKFLSRFFDDDVPSIWKYVLYHKLHKIIGMKQKCECLLMKLRKREMNLLPGVYQEMFLAWQDIENNIEYNMDINQLFSVPIFLNTKICYKQKPLYFEFFIKSGITLLKDITYEVVPGFLPVRAIKEIIWQHFPDLKEQLIENAYMIIMHSIPIEWYNTIRNNVYYRSQDNTPTFVLLYRNIHYQFISCRTSNFYCVLRDDKYQPPTSHSFWTEIFTSIDMNKVSGLICMNSKCPDMIDIDFRIYHNIIYSMEKLHKMRLVDSEMCTLCFQATETILHIFKDCQRLNTFKKFMLYHVENILKNAPNTTVNMLDFDEMLLLGYQKNVKNVNSVFLNLFLSQARLSIFKTRAVFLKIGRKIDLEIFFKYSFEKYCNYILHYFYLNNNREQFFQDFIKYNTLIKYKDGQIMFNW